MQEVELVEAPNIFHEEDDGLKHEMIDVSKAKTIVSALKNLKKEVQAKPDLMNNKGVFSDAKSVSEFGISVLEDKRLSLNLAAFQRTLD